MTHVQYEFEDGTCIHAERSLFVPRLADKVALSDDENTRVYIVCDVIYYPEEDVASIVLDHDSVEVHPIEEECEDSEDDSET